MAITSVVVFLYYPFFQDKFCLLVNELIYPIHPDLNHSIC